MTAPVEREICDTDGRVVRADQEVDALGDHTPSDRPRVRGVASVVGGKQRHLSATPETAVRIQLPDGKAHAAKLVEAVCSLLPGLRPLDRDQEWRSRPR